jgi:hypothetical protein
VWVYLGPGHQPVDPRDRIGGQRSASGGSYGRSASQRGSTGGYNRQGSMNRAPTTRPAPKPTNPSRVPERQPVPTDRQRPAADNAGNRQGNRQDLQNGRQDNRGDLQDDRQDRWDDVRDDRNDRWDDHQDNINDRTEFRQDAYNEHVEHRHYSAEEFYEDRYRYAVGVALTTASFRALTCASRTVVIGGISYYNCGPTWYNRAYSGGNVTYVVVNAPPGY